MRIVLADDSVLFREGLRRLLSEAGFEVIRSVGNVDDLFATVGADNPTVAILDIRMPPTFTTEGLVAAAQLRVAMPGIGVLVLSQYVETYHVMRLINDGARGIGYLLKDRVSDLSEFASAIRRVGQGGSVIDPEVVAQLVRRPGHSPLDALTERERHVLSLMAEGRSNQAIRDRLSLSDKTIETHVHNIFGKLELPATADDHRRVLAVLSYLRSHS